MPWPIGTSSLRKIQIPPALLWRKSSNDFRDRSSLRPPRNASRISVRSIPFWPITTGQPSRYSTWIDVPAGADEEAAWAEYLLGPDADRLTGAVLLSCCDAGIRVIVAHREALAKRFLLDISDPRAQIEMLDKLSTYEHAAVAGVDTPKFWAVATRERLMQGGELRRYYPLSDAARPEYEEWKKAHGR